LAKTAGVLGLRLTRRRYGRHRNRAALKLPAVEDRQPRCAAHPEQTGDAQKLLKKFIELAAEMREWAALAEAARRTPRRICLSHCPAVPEAGVVFNLVKTGIAVAEFLADALHEGSYIGTIALCAVTGEEVLAADEIVNLAVADLLPRLLG
jgi:hypothetical protein